MSLITAKGAQAKESAKKKDFVDTSEIYLRLKDGDSHKVRLLSAEDFVEYTSSGDYNKGIFTQPVAEDSPLIVAYEKGGEDFKNFKPKTRYVFVFGSLETGKLVAWDASKKQANSLMESIDEYEDVIDEIGFNFKRTGTKTETVYSLNPIIKMKDKEKEAFSELDDTEVEMEFYEDIIKTNDDKFVAKLLKEAGFDVDTHLPHIDLSDAESEDDENEDEAEEITDSESDNPLETI